jgi:hypothetical protein
LNALYKKKETEGGKKRWWGRHHNEELANMWESFERWLIIFLKKRGTCAFKRGPPVGFFGENKNNKLCNVVDYPKQFRVRFFDLIFIYLFSRENNMTARASVELLISVQLVWNPVIPVQTCRIQWGWIFIGTTLGRCGGPNGTGSSPSSSKRRGERELEIYN